MMLVKKENEFFMFLYTLREITKLGIVYVKIILMNPIKFNSLD